MTEEKPIHGGRNLIILGAAATVIAIVSTVASLQIYHATGDVYLDRSRPGYISEGEKHNEEDDQKEHFSNEGAITSETIDEYLKELDKLDKRAGDSIDDFSAEALTDEALGIAEDEEEESES